MKFNYCTLFDSKYLSRGLGLYFSLERHCSAFHLYIFAFDDDAYAQLKKMELRYATIISLAEFEDEELLRIKPTRTRQEYCWTCASSTIRYSIDRFHLPECTYLDADIFFFSDPSPLHKELGDKSVLITEHRYSPEYDQSEESGKYCVQFVTFKNDEKGRNVLEWWIKNCIEWCYARFEEGKFGDQKYLDDWITRFDCIVELENLGGGVAPWNVQQYDFSEENNAVVITHIQSHKKYPLIFYHFHDFKFDSKGVWFFGSGALGYRICSDAFRFIYKPYLLELHNLKKVIASRIKTDYPELPSVLSIEEFEGMILPKFVELKHRNLFRSLYDKELNKYMLSQEKLRKEDYDSVFKLFLNSDYHLNRYEYGFHHILEIFNISDTGKSKGKFEELKIQEDLLSHRKAYSWFWFEFSSGINWGKGLQSKPNEIQTENFEIFFPIIELSEPPKKIFWQPMENLYCKVLIEKVQIAGGDKSIEIPVGSITHNGINIEDGWIEFLRLNDLFTIPFFENWIPESIHIIGKWKFLEQWKLGERFQEILSQKQNEIDSILNSTSYSITIWFIKRITWLKKWFVR